MKIIHIVPGSGGGFYCQNCLRDSLLVKALRKQGHDVILVPMYLPLFSDDDTVAGDTPVFYGAISLYLKQKMPWLPMPRWLEKLLDSQKMLTWAAKKAGSTRASGLEDMTLSMLRGEHGRQSAELERLVEWLVHEEKPDIVHLSNALLLGLAHQIRSKVNVPVCCSLQDENAWVDPMSPDWQQRVWGAMADRVPDVAAFFPVSSYYADLMKNRMQIPDDKLHVVPIGIDPDAYSLSETKSGIPVIGYLSRVAESLGFGILVDAFILLKQKPLFAQLQLHVTGGKTGDDEKFILAQQKKLAKNGFLQDVQFYDEYTGQHRIDFLKKCSVVSVPVPDGEAFGMFIIEALACGVPVVQPNTGAFPELVNATGGGIIYQPNTPEKLAETLEALLNDPGKLQELGQTGRKAIEEKFTIDHMAERMLYVYNKLLPLSIEDTRI